MTVKEITVTELKQRLDNNDHLLLIDVRESFEKELADLGGVLIPLGELGRRTGELQEAKQRPIIIYCRSGARSAEACRMLMKAGFPDVKNLRGGILAWARDIDPDLPTY